MLIWTSPSSPPWRSRRPKAVGGEPARPSSLITCASRRVKSWYSTDIVAKVLAARGDHPGLVHIISAMEACNSYKPWHDKQTHRTFLRPDTGKCLHYYFYFIDAELGLIYLRVPTWCPFRLQFYCNGHSWLARQL